MLVTKEYNRQRAVDYARKYAFSQNPVFANFRGIGGNCTNFVSQSIYAGSCVMNYTPTYGWYFVSLDNRSPSWSGVEYFYNFMVGNMGVGPYGREAGPDEVEIGDVIQLAKNDTGYYHTLLIVGFDGEDTLVAAQTDDAYGRPLSTYTYDYSRYIKILGVRMEIDDVADCFDSVFNGIAIIPPENTVIPETPAAPPEAPSTPAPPEVPSEPEAPATPEAPAAPETPTE